MAGGVLGQAIIPGAARQGFVVAANGQGIVVDPKAPVQPRPTPPEQNIKVSIGGTTRDVTTCNPCVTVGLTPEIIGQFAPVAMPTENSALGLIQWLPPTADGPAPSFPNPYGSGTTPNNSAPTNAMYFTVTVKADHHKDKDATATAITLLDTGTKYYSLSSAFGDIKDSYSGTIEITGLTPNQGSITGLPTAKSTFYGKPVPDYYVEGSGTTNTIGIPFFTLNSVMSDLTDKATGYTPFFVTIANLDTTGGPLTVTKDNVPLGLAGIISGSGGVTIDKGGSAQLSATNTYTGPTQINGVTGDQGMLLISGPGSIAASSYVESNGVFDISRAWAPVSITDLRGTGQVNLGGKNLTITDGKSTFSGNIVDGGEYQVTGGSVTIAGGTQTFAGQNTYTGGTYLSGSSTLNLTGSMIGNLTIAPGATFNTNGNYSTGFGSTLINAGSFNSPSGIGFWNAGLSANTGTMNSAVLNTGSFLNNGNLVGNFMNMGTLAGTGGIAGTLDNWGIVAPGTPYGTMTVNGAYTQYSSGTFQPGVSPSGPAGRLSVVGVVGTADLAGSVLAQVQPGGIYAPRTTYTILQATGGADRHLLECRKQLAVPAAEPELRRQQRLSHPADRRLRWRGAQSAAEGGRNRAGRNGSHGDRGLRHRAGHAFDDDAGPGAADPDGAVGHQLCRIFLGHGSGCPALHEQFRRPGHRRRSVGQRPCGARRGLRSRLRYVGQAALRCMGRRNRRPRHDWRRHPAGRRHL